MICPNISSPEWKALVAKVGENRAWKEFLIYGKIPSADNYEVSSQTEQAAAPVVFRSIRTRSTEDIAKGINKDLIRSQKDLKYTGHIMASVLNTLGDISPNQKLNVKPADAFRTVKGIYSEVADNLKMALNGIISSDQDLQEVKASSSYDQILNEFPVLAYVNSYDDMVSAAETYETIVTNFDSYESLVIAEMARKGIRMGKNAVQVNDPQDAAIQQADDTEDTEISQDEIGERYDKSVFETNPRDTASVRVKALVQTIKTGEYELGIPIYADPNDVFADILQAGSEMALTGYTDTYGKLEAFRAALIKRKDARPYLNDLLDKLKVFEDNNQWEKINDILTFATKSFAQETLMLYKTRKDGNEVTGIMDVKVINSNRDTVEDQVAREWLEAHKQSGFFSRSSTGELKPKAEKLAALKKIIEDAKTLTAVQKQEKFKEFFAILGIDLGTKEVEYIASRLAPALRKKDFDTLFSSANMLENIYTSFVNNADQVFDDNYGLQDEKSSMRVMATLYYEANPGRYNISAARTADGKQKYLYILTNFIEKRKRQWLNSKTAASITNTALGRPNKGFWDRVKQGLNTFVPQYFNGIREQQSGKDGKVRKSLTDKEQAVTMLLKHQENLNTATYINFTLSDKTTTVETKMSKEFFVDSESTPLGLGRDYIVNEQGQLQFLPSLVQRAFTAFAAPEISRILATIKYGKDVKVENFELAGRLFYFIPSLNSNPALQEFRDDLYSGQMTMEQLYNKHYTTVGQAILDDMQASAEQQIDQFLANGVIKNNNGEYTFPTSINGFKNTDYINRIRLSGVKGRDAARLMMMDMKLNYMNTQVKMVQFLRFDPAVAFKSFKDFNKSAQFSEISGEDRVKLVAATWDEFSKRAAALIAPGAQGSYSWKQKDGSTYFSPDYTAVTAADVEYDINGTTNTITDAQEYVTLNEHIDGLMSEGKIPLKVWQSIYDKIIKAGPGGYYELSKEELGYVFTPTKPVHVNDVNEASEQAGLNRVDYVKSSRYPLLPQHEIGSERDKLRQWMEKNNIRALNFASGKKLGRPQRSVQLFTKDGSAFIEPTIDQWNAAAQTLSREGLRTQQEIPHQKAEIRTVSQMNRTLLDGMLEETFSIKGIKEMSGSQAKTLKEQVRARLFDIEAEKLQEKLGDLSKSHRGLHNLLKDIILNDTTGSYGENDLRSIELDPRTGMFLYPLEFQFKAKKFQGLINSLINKNVMLKVEGSSFIQVSGVGSRFNFSGVSKGVKNDIIWTDSFAKEFKNGDVSLSYIRKEGDEVKPAQVIVSQYLRDKEGNLIDLSDYITEKKVGDTTVKILDTSSFSKEMFELVGTRIPNQSHPSMLPIEVVGFLPSYMENTIIVPDGITGQMGSDFDVDKLYTYISKMQEEDGKFTTIPYELNDVQDIENMNEDQLKQLYRDIHWMALTHPKAYDKITKSVDMPEVKQKVAEREAMLKKYEISSNKGVMLPLDFMTSINRFNDNRSGKVGVGVFANLISAQADFQDKILRLGVVKDDQEQPDPIPIKLSKKGKVINLVNIGKPGSSVSYVKDENGKLKSVTRTISDNINMMFTESVDNAKNQFLREFNWSEKAMSAIGVFEMLTDEDGNAAPIQFVMDLTSQNYIGKLFTLIDQKQDSFGEYDSNALESSMLELQTDIANKLVDQGYFNNKQEAEDYLDNKDNTRSEVLDPETLNDMWLVGKADELPLGQREAAFERIAKDMGMSVKDLLLAYNTVQYDTLLLFKRIEDIGRELNTILGGVYVYTKGIGPNVFATKQKLNQLNKLAMSTNFLGINNIAGPVSKDDVTGKIKIDPRGEIGAAIDKSLMVAQDIYSVLFPISSGRNIESIVDTLLENQGKKKDQLGREAYINLYDSVFNGIKAYMYTMPGLELFENSRETRSRLVNGDSSIGKRIMDLVKDPAFKRNGFLKNIEVKQAPKQEAYTINFKAPFGTDLDEKSIMSGFYELATSDKEEVRQLAKDLAIYPYLTGDAGNIGRFVPVDYLMGDADFNDMVSALDYAYSINMDQPGAMSTLITQIVQNNPEAFAKSYKYSTYSGALGTKDNVFKRVLKKLVGGAEELSKVDNFSIKVGDFEADDKGANIAKSLQVPVSDRELKMLKDLGVDPSSVKFKYPPFILINDTYASEYQDGGFRNVNYLYKRVSDITDPVGSYERINILGYNGIQEYDFNNPQLLSSVKNNNNVEDDPAFQPAAPVVITPSAPVVAESASIEELKAPTVTKADKEAPAELTTLNQKVESLKQKGISIIEQDGQYDIMDDQDGVLAEYIPTLEQAVQRAEEALDRKLVTQTSQSLVTYAYTNYIIETDAAGNVSYHFAQADGSKTTPVNDAGLIRKIRLAQQAQLHPERVVTIQIGSKEQSYYVLDNRIFSLQLTSYGNEITSKDLTKRVFQQMGMKLEDKQPEPEVKTSETAKPTFTYKGTTVNIEFTLSAEQTQALEKLIDFVETRTSGDGTYDGTYTLEGYAGTGKTSIIGILDRYMDKKTRGTKFIYMAPTHAATVALGNNIVKYGANELPMTVQSAVTESQDPMRPGPKFTKKLTDRAKGIRNIIVLDEASMLANKDFDKLISAAKAEGFKVIFMGDPKQIPEVTPGAKTKELAKAFANPNKSELTNVFRTKDNNILTVLTNIRNNNDFVEYEFESTDNMKQLNRTDYNEELINDLQTNLEEVTIINYTNDGVAKINKAARDVLGHTGPLKAGEKIVGYAGSQTKQIEKGHLANSVSYMVEDVSVQDEGAVVITATSKALTDLQKAGMKGFPVKASFTYLQLSPNDSFNFELTPQQMEYNRNELKKRLKRIHELNELYKRKGISYPSYLVQVGAIRTELADFNTGNRYIYNPTTDQVESYDMQKHKGINPNLEMDKGVDFGYGITVHKSQGMTIPIVYFDTNSLSVVSDTTITRNGEKFNTEKNALYYVGMSRAANKLVVPKNLVGNVPTSTPPAGIAAEVKPVVTQTNYDPIQLFLEAQKEEAVNAYVAELFGTEKTVSDYKGFLNKLFSSTNPLNKAIITAISKTGQLAPVTFKIDMSLKDMGTYDSSSKTITINPKLAVADAVDIEDMKTKIHEVIMHELVHHVTVDLLTADPAKLSPEQRKWVKAINNLFDQVQQKMLDDPKHADSLIMAMSAMDSNGFMSASDKSLYYGLTNVYDFVTMMMTDKGFQQFMNNVEFTGERSVLQRFMDLVVSLIKSLGIQVKDNSVLNEGLKNIIGLLDSRTAEGAETASPVQKSPAIQQVNKEYIAANFETILNVLNIKTKC